MITEEFHIIEITDLNQDNKELDYSASTQAFINQYTGLSHQLYVHAEEMEDKTFILKMKNKFPLLDKSIYDSCKGEILSLYSSNDEFDRAKQKRIDEIRKELKNTDFSETKKERRVKVNLISKLAYLEKNISKKVSFGGKNLLRDITRVNNKLLNNNTKNEIISLTKKQKKSKLNNDEINRLSNLKKEVSDLEVRLKELKLEYKTKRERGLYIIGRACEYGNRKYDFNLNEKYVIFKPNKNTKYKIKFTCSNKKQLDLNKLQSMLLNKEIPLTIRLYGTKIQLIYDEKKLAGYAFDEISYKKDLNDKKKFFGNLDTEAFKNIKKQISKKFAIEMETRMLENKVNFRYLSVDLNPTGVGYVIAQYNSNTKEIRTIEKEFIEFSKLSEKLGLPSFNKKAKRQNNRRKYFIAEIWKYIFDKAKHYKVSNFIYEDLDFKHKDKDYITASRGFNKQRNNIWCRGLTIKLINKYCNTLGIKQIDVEPMYSSFIGNMTHNDFDAIAAAMELLRRGITKYEKGRSLFPSITRINQEKLYYLLGKDSLLMEDVSWKQLYKLISISGLRYRNMDKKLSMKTVLNLGHSNNYVKIYKGNNNQEVILV